MPHRVPAGAVDLPADRGPLFKTYTDNDTPGGTDLRFANRRRRAFESHASSQDRATPSVGSVHRARDRGITAARTGGRSRPPDCRGLTEIARAGGNKGSAGPRNVSPGDRGGADRRRSAAGERKLPRLASAALACSVVPGSLGGHLFWTETDPERKVQQRREFLTDLSLIGALMIASVDTEGKPSLGWRGRRAARRVAEAVGGAAVGNVVHGAVLDRVSEKMRQGLHTGAERGRELADVAGERVPPLLDITRERGAEFAEAARERGADLAQTAQIRGKKAVMNTQKRFA